MPGHNGGFNPFRGPNGQFTDGGTSGASGKTRGGGAAKVTRAFRGTDEDAPAKANRGYRTAAGAVKTLPRDLAATVRQAQLLRKDTGRASAKGVGRSAAAQAAAKGQFIANPKPNADGSATVYRNGDHEVRLHPDGRSGPYTRVWTKGVAGNAITSGTANGIASSVSGVVDTVRNQILKDAGGGPHAPKK
ncbi:hypothetical protein EKD04_009475 [Chloroflexales bacterium ZM16-3]|nr:hypothetical protein [Chloroflexales bacterium ZM16-3]